MEKSLVNPNYASPIQYVVGHFAKKWFNFYQNTLLMLMPIVYGKKVSENRTRDWNLHSDLESDVPNLTSLWSK